MPVLMLDLNDRLGRPRAEEPHDLIGTMGAGVEGDSATRFRALSRRHSIAVPQKFHLATPTFSASSGRSRIDFVATPPSVRPFQLIPAAGPRVHMPLTMDLVTNGMRHCPDPTRGGWDHEKIEEMLSDPVARLTFFEELETQIRNSSIVGLAATKLLMTHGRTSCRQFRKQLAPTYTRGRHDPLGRLLWNEDVYYWNLVYSTTSDRLLMRSESCGESKDRDRSENKTLLLSTDMHVSSVAQASGRNTVVLDKFEPTPLLR